MSAETVECPRMKTCDIASECYHGRVHVREDECARPCERGKGAVCGSNRIIWRKRLANLLKNRCPHAGELSNQLTKGAI